MNDRAYTNAQRRGLLANLVAQATSGSFVYALAPLAVLIQSDLGLTRAELGLVLSMTNVGMTIIALPGGWLTDSLGVRRVVWVGLLVGGLGFCALSLVDSLPLSLAFLLLAGLGGGVIPAASTKAIYLWFAVRVRGTAMGIKQTGFPLGGALTAGLLPTMALALGGWRPALVGVGLAAVAAGALYLWLYSDHPSDGSTGPRQRIGLATMRSVLVEPRFLALAALGFTYGYFGATWAGYLSLYLQETLGLGIVAAGAFLMGSQVSGATARLAFGIISDRYFDGRRAPMLLAITLANAILALGFGWALPALGPWGQAVLILALGATAIGWSSLYHVFVAEMAGHKLAGTVLGLCMMAMSVGGVVGLPLFGYIVDVSRSYPLAWATQTVLGVMAAVIILWLNRQSARSVEAVA